MGNSLKSRVALTCSLLFSISCSATANGQQITAGANVQVSRARGNDPHNEVLIAADPQDSNHLLAVSMVRSNKMQKHSSAVYASFDAGKTWTPTLDTANQGYSIGADPACTYGLDGSAYFSVIVAAPDNQEGGQQPLLVYRLLVYRSRDAGRTWLAPYSVPGSNQIDRQYITIDDTASKYRGRIYLNAQTPNRPVGSERGVMALSLFRSLDGGASFDLPSKRAAPADARSTLHPGNSVVLSDGNVVSIFTEIRKPLNDDGTPGRIRYDVDQPNALIKVISSEDGGESLSGAVIIGDVYVNWPKSYALSTFPYLSVDRRSKYFKDRLYAVWPDSRSGRAEIYFSYSIDHGKTWMTPKVVNDDRPFELNNVAKGPDDFLPVVAVNPDGVVGIMWYDRRDHPDNLGWHIRFTASLDGGDTFLPSVRVSEAPMSSCEKENWSILGGSNPTSKGNPLTLQVNLDLFCLSGGHTAGMAADVNGLFHPLWIDNRTGVRQVWTAAVAVRGTVIPNGSSELASLQDISDKASLEVSSMAYDKARQLITVDARLKNISNVSVSGPLKLRVIALRWPLAGVVSILNADNGLKGTGAVWDFSSLINSNALKPGEVSAIKKLVFRMSEPQPDMLPLIQGGNYKSLLSMDARVLGGR